VRENGAAVFRVDTENRQRRIEMDQIAIINMRNGEIKPHGEQTLSEDDLARIHSGREERASVLAHRDIDDLHRAVD
jgi:phage FluMu protein gp41